MAMKTFRMTTEMLNKNVSRGYQKPRTKKQSTVCSTKSGKLDQYTISISSRIEKKLAQFRKQQKQAHIVLFIENAFGQRMQFEEQVNGLATLLTK